MWLCGYQLSAINDSLQWGLNYNIGYGFLLPHHPKMKPLADHHFYLHELNIFKKTSGNHHWHHHFNFPETGISILYSDLVDPALGSAIAIYPYIDYPILPKNRWLSFKGGIGLGYLTKKHDLNDNHENIAIGSHLNAAISLQLNMKFGLGKFDITTGPALTHFSNGTITMPNLGINLMHWKLGLSYHQRDNTIPNINIPESAANWIRSSLSWGIREIAPPGSNLYHAVSLTGQFQNYWTTKVDYVYGADIFYNSSINARFDDEIPDLSSKLNNLQLGASGGIVLKMNPIQFTFQMGAYLLDKHRLDGSFYHRYGFLFLVRENYGFNLTLKTHFAKADFIETGIFYRLKR